MSKAEVLVLAQAHIDSAVALKAAVDSLPEVDPKIEELEKKIKEQAEEIVSLKVDVDAKAALLAQVDAAAKAIDAAIADS